MSVTSSQTKTEIDFEDRSNFFISFRTYAMFYMVADQFLKFRDFRSSRTNIKVIFEDAGDF